MSYDDEFVIRPPDSVTVDLKRKPVLWLPDGRMMVRTIGFTQQKADFLLDNQSVLRYNRRTSSTKSARRAGVKAIKGVK